MHSAPPVVEQDEMSRMRIANRRAVSALWRFRDRQVGVENSWENRFGSEAGFEHGLRSTRS